MIRQPDTRGASAGTLMRCGIALGSNVGDRLRSLTVAAAALQHLADFSQPVLKSAVYETAPVGCAAGTPSFYNAVVELSYYGWPEALLERLRAIEVAMGRPAVREKNAPRTLDLDLLYADRFELATDTLELPHPRLAQRRFVLQPLADVHPGLVLPGQTRSVAELLADLPPEEPALTLVTRDW